MVVVNIGGKVKLAPEALEYLNSITRHHGGQTRPWLLVKAIEFYVSNRVPEIVEDDLKAIKAILCKIRDSKASLSKSGVIIDGRDC